MSREILGRPLDESGSAKAYLGIFLAGVGLAAFSNGNLELPFGGDPHKYRQLTVNAKLTDAEVSKVLGCDLSQDMTPHTLRKDYEASSKERACAEKAAKAILENSYPKSASKADLKALSTLWDLESGWGGGADNPYSTAFGIPQALIGSEMRGLATRAVFGGHGATAYNNCVYTQLRWGLKYINKRYGDPEAAMVFKKKHGWY